MRLTPGLIVILSLLGVGSVQENIKPQEFDKLFNSIKPSGEEEKWLSIPWQTDLLKAAKTAAEHEKPIFIWAMNGHPLGCT